MPVPYCYLCRQQNQATPDAALNAGDYCPVCHNPTCQQHLKVVRFRWRETRQVDSALVCEDCKRSYAHRYWDSARRDWIS